MFRNNRGRGGSVALLYRETSTCSEIQHKARNRPVESLWVKVRRENMKRNVMVGIHYRPLKWMRFFQNN